MRSLFATVEIPNHLINEEIADLLNQIDGQIDTFDDLVEVEHALENDVRNIRQFRGELPEPFEHYEQHLFRIYRHEIVDLSPAEVVERLHSQPTPELSAIISNYLSKTIHLQQVIINQLKRN